MACCDNHRYLLIKIGESVSVSSGWEIVTYSSKRAAKDTNNRRKGMERLRKAYVSGKITKDKINKRGYSKFLNIDNDVKVSIDDRRIRKDEVWDGLKGYITNTSLPPSEVVAQYREPWVVEKAFRISKGTLETRPVFHFTEKRIEAHVCLCFVAYKVYKKLERIIADKRGQCHKDRQDNNDNKTQAAIKQRDDYAYHDADT